MPILSRTVLLAWKATALVATVGHVSAPLSANAAPLPIPVPMAAHIADYAAHPPASTNSTVAHQMEEFGVTRRDADGPVVNHTPSYSSLLTRQEDITSLLSGLQTNSDKLGVLAADPASGDKADLIRAVLSGLKSLMEGVAENQVLNTMGGDKGLMHYDSDNGLETALKDTVNSIKYSLTALPPLMENLNLLGLGDILAEIVYILKCIIDLLLDTIENATDGALNDGALTEVRELLLQLQGQSSTMMGQLQDQGGCQYVLSVLCGVL